MSFQVYTDARGGGRSGRGRGRGGGRSGSNPTGTRSTPKPAATPASTGHLTFERASFFQCESNKKYCVGTGSPEETYFMTKCFETLNVASKMTDCPKHPGLMAAYANADAEFMDIEHIKYHNLRLIPNQKPDKIPIEFQGDFTTEEYVCYEDEDGNVYAINPDGYHYHCLKSNSWPYTFELVMRVEMENFNLNSKGEVTQRPIHYAIQLSCKSLPKNYSTWDGTELMRAYLHPVKPNSQVIQIQMGEIAQGVFCPWPALGNTPAHLFVGDRDLVDALFKQANWRLAPELHEPANDMPFIMQGGSTGSETLQNIDHKLCVWSKKGKDDEGTWTHLANFAVDAVLAIYEFADGSNNTPRVRIKVHRRIHYDNEDTLYITPEFSDMSDQSAGLIEAEIILAIHEIKDHRELGAEFAKVSALLLTEKLGPLTLKQWLNQLEWPEVTRVATNFGRQKNSDLFVMGNVCFQKGQVMPHEEAGITLLPAYFSTGINGLLPVRQDEFPRIMVVPQPWIRYGFFMRTFVEDMPNMFHNNYIPALAAVASAMMHMQYTKYTSGQALNKCCFASYLHSSAAGTGKSEICSFINGLVGQTYRGMWVGAMGTMPAVMARLKQQSCLSLALDEIVMRDQKNDKDYSVKLKHLVHSVYDQTVRGCMTSGGTSQGETKPLTSFIGTSNIIPNEDDDAFLQRLLLIKFEPLNAQDSDSSLSSSRNTSWQVAKEVASCLLPDFEAILHKGKLDAEAINDCCTFMNQACGHHFSRNANGWGMLLYHLLQLEALMQADKDDLDKIFEYVCRTAVRQDYFATKQSSPMSAFVLLLDEVRSSLAQNPLALEEKSIHWHNFRTSIKPVGFASLTTGAYYAVRLDSVINVIKTVKKVPIKKTEILRAVEDCAWASFGRGKFYNPMYNPFPISEERVDEATGISTRVPLPEESLEENTLEVFNCLFMKKANYDEIITAVASVNDDLKDYTTIAIKSAKPDWNGGQPYNFYHTVICDPVRGCPTGWFGYRGAAQCPLGRYSFVGGNGALHMRTAPPEGTEGFLDGLQEQHKQAGWPGIYECFHPLIIKAHFMESLQSGLPPLTSTLPPCFKYNPFKFRNDPGDTPMPNDPDTLRYLQGLGTPPSSPARSRTAMGSTPGSLRGGAGSSRFPLTDSPGNSPAGGPNDDDFSSKRKSAPPNAPKPSKRMKSRVVESDDEEGEELGEEDEEVVSYRLIEPFDDCSSLTPQCPFAGRGGDACFGRGVHR